MPSVCMLSSRSVNQISHWYKTRINIPFLCVLRKAQFTQTVQLVFRLPWLTTFTSIFPATEISTSDLWIFSCSNLTRGSKAYCRETLEIWNWKFKPSSENVCPRVSVLSWVSKCLCDAIYQLVGFSQRMARCNPVLVGPCRTYGGQSSSGTGIPSNTSVFLCRLPFHQYPILIWYPELRRQCKQSRCYPNPKTKKKLVCLPWACLSYMDSYVEN
jgi:hypothetical protein